MQTCFNLSDFVCMLCYVQCTAYYMVYHDPVVIQSIFLTRISQSISYQRVGLQFGHNPFFCLRFNSCYLKLPISQSKFAVGAGGGGLDILSRLSFLPSFSLSVGDGLICD